MGAGSGLEDFATALTSVMSIALGVLIGVALYRVGRRGAEEIGQFHVDVPAALAETEAPPLWARFVPGTPNSFWGHRRRHRDAGAEAADPAVVASATSARPAES